MRNCWNVLTDIELLSVGEACEILDVKPARLNTLVWKFAIPHYRTRVGKIFRREHIEAFREERKDRLKHRRKSE